jgi:hypothetical protein
MLLLLACSRLADGHNHAPKTARRPPGDLTGNLYTLRQFAMARKFRTAAVQLKTRNPLKKGKQGVLVKPRKKSLVTLYAKMQGGEGGLGDIAEGGSGGGRGGGAAAEASGDFREEDEEGEEETPVPAPKAQVRYDDV